MKTPTIPKVEAVLNVSKLTVHDLIGKTTSVLTSLTGNKLFPSPTPALAVLTGQLGDLSAAQTKAATHIKGAAADRNVKRVALTTGLHQLRGYVQTIADGDPANAESIILSSGMAVKKAKVSHPKQDLVANHGTVSGSVKLVAKASGRASYEWASSGDGKTWMSLPPTFQAHTTVDNLTPGSTVYFRHRVVTKAGAGDWGQGVSHIVQ